MLNQKKLTTKVLVELANILANVSKKGIIRSGDDMNNYAGLNKTGFYEIQSGVANAPTTWVWCIIIGGTGTLQLVFSASRIYVRAYTGNPLAWTTWKGVNLT